MAVYHNHNKRKVRPGDTVTRKSDGVQMTVEKIYEYQRRGAGVVCVQNGTFLCSEVGCFHSTGDADVWSGTSA